MAISLKDRNIRRLAAVPAANYFAYLLIVRGDALATAEWCSAFLAAELLPVGLGLGLISVANGLLSAQVKARLVFWRWRHPLPGCRAFSVHAKKDARISLPGLRVKVGGSFPKSEVEQNSCWYELYRSIESNIAVTHAHREYLFNRDYAALAALMLITLGGIAFLQASSTGRACAYLSFLIVQYLLVRLAAANYGQRFVTTVLAIKSSET